MRRAKLACRNTSRARRTVIVVKTVSRYTRMTKRAELSCPNRPSIDVVVSKPKHIFFSPSPVRSQSTTRPAAISARISDLLMKVETHQGAPAGKRLVCRAAGILSHKTPIN